MRGPPGRSVALILAPALAIAAAPPAVPPARAEEAGARVVVGSKAFAESWILGDAAVLLLEGSGAAEAEHRRNLGGTEIVYAALREGSIDLYPEYTGTIAEVLLKDPTRPSIDSMRERLRPHGIGISPPLGFNDSYALAASPEAARRLGLRRISDLADHRDLRLSLSHEFLGRQDGYPGLRAAYGLDAVARGIQHDLAYTAIANGETDVIDVYTTDAQIQRLDLKVLEDDRGFFPRYDAVLLYRLDLPARAPRAFEALSPLFGRIDEEKMIRANARVVLDREESAAAARALVEEALGTAARGVARTESRAKRILANTATHLKLTLLSLLAAIAAGIPLGILASRSRLLGRLALSATGLMQTIPSLALLAFLIPLLGIGARPALVALFLYSLLPIVRNTCTGLATIPPQLVEAAEALGLPERARLRRVLLPLASPSIASGIKTSAVINVGTATLAALIGAGGLGEPILQGIALRDSVMILEGAVPAGALALAVEGALTLADPLVIPRGLRRMRRARS